THTIDSKIFGPHFEAITREWVSRYAPDEVGLEVGATGQSTIACRQHKTSHEIDILALVRGGRPRTAGTPIAFLGEAKYHTRPPGLAELRRLEHIRELLTAAGHDASHAALGVFSATGFTDELTTETARTRPPILLVNLARLYG